MARGLGARARALVAVAAMVAVGAVGTGPAAADEGVAVETQARYVVDGAGGPVQVAVTVRLTNTTPDTAQWLYFYDTYAIAVPAGATGVTATSDGRPLRVEVSDSEDPSTQYAEASFAPLYHGRSRTLEWTYQFAGAPVRSERLTRVGPGYATFAVEASGDAGHVSVEVVAPAAMTVDTSAGDFVATPDGDTVRYVATTSTDDAGIWAVVSARDPLVADQEEVTLAGETVTLESFPGDTEWADFVAGHVDEGFPVLEELIGADWPGGLKTIREDVAPQALQYAWFDSEADNIVVAEDLDAVTLFHELAHTWFDGSNVVDRWLFEGLAETVAQRVVTETDGSATPRPTPARDAEAAVPLTAWTDDDHGSFEREDYAYAASYTAVSALLAGLDDEELAAVLAGTFLGESAYAPAGSHDVPWTATDWRRFLDLVEVRGGVTDADTVYRSWVVTPEQVALLEERATARTTYTAVDDADGAWQPPLGVRRAMASWQFADAVADVDALADAPRAAAAVAAAAQAAGLPEPAAVRDVYEGAVTTDDYAGLTVLLDRTAEALPVLGEAHDRAEGGSDPFSQLGQLVLGVDDTEREAAAAMDSADPETARAAAEDAIGRARLAPLVGALLVLLVVAAGGVVGWRVRRARRRHRVDPGTQDQPGSVVQDALEEQVVLPASGDAQVLLGEPVPDEPVVLEDGLRGDVVDEGRGLEAVEAELVPGEVDDHADGGRHEALAGARRGDPVAEAGGVERAAHDRRDVHAPDDVAVVGDEQ